MIYKRGTHLYESMPDSLVDRVSWESDILADTEIQVGVEFYGSSDQTT